MRKSRATLAIGLTITLILSSCGGASESASDVEADASVAAVESPTAVPEEPTVAPTAEPTSTPEPAPTATPEPTATAVPTPTPEPTPVLAADDRPGDFQCSNQEALEVTVDPGISEELETLIGPGVPGIIAATASSDGLLRVGSAGVRTANGTDAMLATDRVHLGSDTKAMTGTLVALLAAEGEIELTTPLTDLWPDADEGWEGVTLLDLLKHRGGAEDSLGRDQAGLWQQLWNASIPTQSWPTADRAEAAKTERARFANVLTTAPPSEEVGEFAYSNSGYMLVGAALEAQLGSSWEALMCEYVFGPLRMDGCGFGPPLGPAPRGHSGTPGSLRPADPAVPGSDNPFALGPAGTVHCPIADWAKYLSWVLQGANGEDDRLSAETWEMLLEPEGDYAAGWIISARPWANGRTLSHAGSNTQWFAIAWLAPGLDRAFMAVTNAATADAQTATDTAIGYLVQSDS